MCHERHAGAETKACHQVDDAGGNARLLQDLDQVIRGKRRILRGLQHNGVAAYQSGHDLPGRNSHRKIPRRHQPADADRTAYGHTELALQLGRRSLAELPPPFACHIKRHVDGFLHVAAGLFEHLAHLACHLLSQRLFPLLQKAGGTKQDLAALGGRQQSPGFVSLLGGCYGIFHIAGIRFLELAHQFMPVGRIQIVKGLSATCFDPLTVDEIPTNSGRCHRYPPGGLTAQGSNAKAPAAG